MACRDDFDSSDGPDRTNIDADRICANPAVRLDSDLRAGASSLCSHESAARIGSADRMAGLAGMGMARIRGGAHGRTDLLGLEPPVREAIPHRMSKRSGNMLN